VKVNLTTERFILRDLEPSDAGNIFDLDSDPKVHEFLGKKPLTDISQAKRVVETVREQYKKYGIGRWAVEDRLTGQFLGWCGLKYEENVRDFSYVDIGYRLKPEFWGRGVATETALASLNYGFEQLNLDRICGAADANHDASIAVLKKIGLQYSESFVFNGELCNFYALSQTEWLSA
jgi:ribosomal-protein-alanine N-acetyltransferase